MPDELAFIFASLIYESFSFARSGAHRAESNGLGQTLVSKWRVSRVVRCQDECHRNERRPADFQSAGR